MVLSVGCELPVYLIDHHLKSYDYIINMTKSAVKKGRMPLKLVIFEIEVATTDDSRLTITNKSQALISVNEKLETYRKAFNFLGAKDNWPKIVFLT